MFEGLEGDAAIGNGANRVPFRCVSWAVFHNLGEDANGFLFFVQAANEWSNAIGHDVDRIAVLRIAQLRFAFIDLCKELDGRGFASCIEGLRFFVVCDAQGFLPVTFIGWKATIDGLEACLLYTSPSPRD